MSPRTISPLLGGLLLAPALAPPLAHAQDSEGPLVLRGVVLRGEPVEPIPDGGVVVSGGKIVAVGPFDELRLPSGARIQRGAWITPGLVDAHSTLGVEAETWAEHQSEVVPHLRVLDGVDLLHPDFARALRRGVTTVYVSPGPGSVVGGQGCTLKTGGPLARRVVQADGAVKANLGPEAWARGVRNRGPWGEVDFRTRRPTTLMGAVWVFREAFAKARAGRFPGPAGHALAEVLAGHRPLRVQARLRGTIETALRLAEEFSLPVVLEEATEAYEVLDLLAAARVRVIYGPTFERPRGVRATTGEADRPCLRTPRLLLERGIPFCLTANDRRDEDGLWAQALWATRYGLSTPEALAAVSAWAADIIGGAAAERVGRLAPGRDADVVLWSGEPFAATTRAELVLIDGAVVHGRLNATPAPLPSRPAPVPEPEKRRFK